VTRQQLQIIFCLPLAAAVIVSAVGVVQTKHQARQLFVELESLNRERDRLQVDWGRLRLEESTLGSHSQIETVARERLSLALPGAEQIIMIAEPTP
jgi:cell division protein FtsL